MSALITVTKAYRLYVWIGSERYYANRSGSTPLPRVNWRTTNVEYPSHFSLEEARSIHEFYIDQQVRYEEIYINDEGDNS